MYPRSATRAVRAALADTPVAVIQAARQVGKSKRAQTLASERDSIVLALDKAELVKAKIARGLGLAESSAGVYLRLARTMRPIVELPAWGRNPRSHLVRRPKTCLD